MSRGYTQGKVVICPKCGKECRKGFASAQHAAKHDREAQAPSTASFRMTRVYSAIGRDVVIGNVIWEKGFLPFRAKARNTGENFKLTESEAKNFKRHLAEGR